MFFYDEFSGLIFYGQLTGGDEEQGVRVETPKKNFLVAYHNIRFPEAFYRIQDASRIKDSGLIRSTLFNPSKQEPVTEAPLGMNNNNTANQMNQFKDNLKTFSNMQVVQENSNKKGIVKSGTVNPEERVRKRKASFSDLINQKLPNQFKTEANTSFAAKLENPANLHTNQPLPVNSNFNTPRLSLPVTMPSQPLLARNPQNNPNPNLTKNPSLLPQTHLHPTIPISQERLALHSNSTFQAPAQTDFSQTRVPSQSISFPNPSRPIQISLPTQKENVISNSANNLQDIFGKVKQENLREDQDMLNFAILFKLLQKKKKLTDHFEILVKRGGSQADLEWLLKAVGHIDCMLQNVWISLKLTNPQWNGTL